MSNVNFSSFSAPRVLADDIERYETMPIEQVEAELSRAGIDPKRTVDAVLEIVQEHLDRESGRKNPEA